MDKTNQGLNMKTIFLLLFGLQYTFANPIQTLISDTPINNHVEKTEKKFYKITLPKNKTLRVRLTNLQADVDLYVKKGERVRVQFNDCYSSKGRTSDEECLVTNEGESSQYTILVYGFRESDYRVNATIEDAEQITNLTKDIAIHDSVEYKGEKIYKYLIKKNKPTTVTLSDLTADADLRIKLGKRVNLNTFDCKSTNGGTKVDECTITSKKDDTLYIQVYGYRSANYSLKVSQEIASYVKNVCTNHIRDNKVICLEEYHRAYYMEEESNEHPMGYHLLHMFNTEKGKWREIAKKPFADEYTPTIEKLEDTPLILITTYFPHSSDAHIYYNTPQTNSFKEIFSLHQDDTIKIDSIKTINRGKVLSIKSYHNGSGENFDALYDIGHLPKITLIQ